MSSAPARPLVVLVGPPGAGKSSVGQAVARTTGVGFRDTDDDVARALGKSISEVFVDDGEAAFRAAEREAVARALAEHVGVLALGGGAVTDEATRGRLSEHTVVFLDVSLTDAVARVGLARDRPLLLGSPRSQLKQLMDARRPLYEQVASIVVDTSGASVDEVAERVLTGIGEARGEAGS
ncbi:MAG: shikimate kinase [Jiangellales bacterium]